jgi:hypothetical protein
MHIALSALIARVSPHTPPCLRPPQTLRKPPAFSWVSERFVSVPLLPGTACNMVVALSTHVREELDGHADPLCLLSRAHCTSPGQLRPAAAGAPAGGDYPLAHLACTTPARVTRNPTPLLERGSPSLSRSRPSMWPIAPLPIRARYPSGCAQRRAPRAGLVPIVPHRAGAAGRRRAHPPRAHIVPRGPRPIAGVSPPAAQRPTAAAPPTGRRGRTSMNVSSSPGGGTVRTTPRSSA